LVAVATFFVGLVYASFAEWVIHRYAMHRPIVLLNVSHFFVGHAKVHHKLYAGDDSYLLGDRPPVELTLAWWAEPMPILLHAPALGLVAWLVGIPMAAGLLAAFIVYQTAYEYLHYCMHVPQKRWFEGTWAFRWINTHHLQHHRKHFTNLNVVLPIADFILRTRCRLVDGLYSAEMTTAGTRA
jgi:hypothetical protein